jgi:hypothetical protein
MVDTVKATINGQEYSLTYSEATGKYEATLTAPSITSYNQPGGYYGVSVTATDTATNSTTVNSDDATLGSALRLVVKEKVKPTISITSPGAGAMLTNNKPTLEAQLRDEVNGSGIKITTLSLKIDGGSSIGNTATGMTCTAVSGGYDISYVVQSALSDGEHTFTVDIGDNDDNTATQASRTFSIDTVAPTLNVSTPIDNSITNNATCAITGTTNDTSSSPVTVAIKLNNVDQGEVIVNAQTGAFSKNVTITEGENTIAVTATDSAGKATINTIKVTLDTVAPVISAVSIIPNPADAGQTYIISVTVTD